MIIIQFTFGSDTPAHPSLLPFLLNVWYHPQTFLLSSFLYSLGSRSFPCHLFVYSSRPHQVLLARSHRPPNLYRNHVTSSSSLPPENSPLSLFSSPNDRESQLQPILSRLHVLIIGPGLGREHHMQSLAKTAIHLARKAGIFIVLDADALYLIANEPSLIHGYTRAVLTPNISEFKRLSDKLGVDPDTVENRAECVSRRLGGVTVLQKGPKDIIATDSSGKSLLKGADKEFEKAKEVVQVDIPGGLKRCGGQGDILSGAVGTFMAWGKCYENGAFGYVFFSETSSPLSFANS